MVEGPKRHRGTQRCPSVLLRPTPPPTPRSQPRPPKPHLRVLLRTPSRRSTCPCSRSKSSPTRNAPTRKPPPWTGPRKMNSSATYRPPQLCTHIFYTIILTQRHQKDFFFLNIMTLNEHFNYWHQTNQAVL